MGDINGHGEAISKVYICFLQPVTGKRSKRTSDGTWRQEGEESILKAEETQDVRTYINRRQATVDQWVALCPIFLIFAKQEIGYKYGGPRRPTWWRRTAADAQLRVTLEDISEEARERRRQESRRRGRRG